MGRSTVHYADNETNNILKRLHNKLRPAGTPVERVEYIIELLLLRIFEAKLKQDGTFTPLRKLFEGENYRLLFSHLLSLTGEQVLSELNKNIFPFYASILTKARQVISGNMPTKMQDQLVLMEEVFANSNFTNNVKGGVIAEVIGLINEIDEKWILKTDLLGDAIESALSETGGTKDLGLHRTPNHIRQMMVAMVDPDFTDTAIDPTCGTAGFLFDTYDYVIKKARETRLMPPEHIANQFYRTGICGIEYQGRIRKMAAVNMYIRGLNPHNIAQGDALKMYDPSRDAGSKSVVITNPPFGAERDQPAYPNVWEEYSKESETTILFVKLIFDLLKVNGRCAVVVSEGFLTWGQNSACALRKLLLNEANLRAIISLPQGVFVSKGGQGAKTSILYFEKGQPTDFVWYYKIENDGFSMGTNRKPIEGSQIPQLLDIFKEIKQGKKPKDTKHSFCIPKEWIEMLDPRVAERIKKEVKERFTEKNKAKREKLLTGLNEKLAKDKLSKAMYDEKLWQFDNIVESQIDNEVAKAIEKANSYHFNLQNYRSNLSEEQIKEWQSVCHPFTICHSEQIQQSEQLPHFNQSPQSEQLPHSHPEQFPQCHSERSEESQCPSIEKRYQELKTADPKTALKILASFDPKNALQMDIAKEYLSKLDKKALEKEEKLAKLDEILRKGFQYLVVKLGDILQLSGNEKVGSQDVPVLSVTMRNGLVDQSEKFGKRIASEDISGYKLVRRNQLVVGFPIDEGVLSFQQNYDIAAVSPAYDVWEIKDRVNANVKYLELVLQSNKAREVYKSKMIGAAGRRRTIPKDIFLGIQIPLPPLEVQNEIVEKIEKQKQIIAGAERIEGNFDFSLDDHFEEHILIEELIKNEEIEISSGDFLPQKEQKGGTIPVYGGNGIQGYHNSSNYTGETISIGRVGAKCGCVHYINGACWITDNSFALVVKTNKLLPKYLSLLLQKENLHQYATTSAQPSINQAFIKNLKIPLPPLETQRQIVEKLDRQMQGLEGVQLLKTEAQKRIEEILAEVWGE